MSKNGIYIGCFNDDGGEIYKVIYAQNIDCCDYNPSIPTEVRLAYIVYHYSEAPTFNTLHNAYKCAERMVGQMGLGANNIVTIKYGIYLPKISIERANKIIKEHRGVVNE